MQDVPPYGVQILLASVSPLAIAGKVYYCRLLAAAAIGFVLWPSRHAVVAGNPVQVGQAAAD